ncbi:hypothetical protein DPPLL_18290 [Desulfofustis limnaeus]|uniref:Uncharacterized protein n=1 Tax=Desulfofustis limnaeus TaxID=2740163 RepID=A0ABM7W953_9BACT|nr:hypothetical protein DPPLL_18290 [Desulfofustis limnaeus]
MTRPSPIFTGLSEPAAPIVSVPATGRFIIFTAGGVKPRFYMPPVFATGLAIVAIAVRSELTQFTQRLPG